MTPGPTSREAECMHREHTCTTYKYICIYIAPKTSSCSPHWSGLSTSADTRIYRVFSLSGSTVIGKWIKWIFLRSHLFCLWSQPAEWSPCPYLELNIFILFSPHMLLQIWELAKVTPPQLSSLLRLRKVSSFDSNMMPLGLTIIYNENNYISL